MTQSCFARHTPTHRTACFTVDIKLLTVKQILSHVAAVDAEATALSLRTFTVCHAGVLSLPDGVSVHDRWVVQ